MFHVSGQYTNQRLNKTCFCSTKVIQVDMEGVIADILIMVDEYIE